nr:MAG TPA: hypothetical protein [Bacteriophage sp.]
MYLTSIPCIPRICCCYLSRCFYRTCFNSYFCNLTFIIY